MILQEQSARRLAARLCLAVASVLLAVLLCEAALRILLPKYRDAADEGRLQAPDSPSRTTSMSPLRSFDFSDVDLVSATTVGVFGDSFVDMPFVGAPYVLTEPLDYLLDLVGDFAVLNFGVEGYGPGQSYSTYRALTPRKTSTSCCSSTSAATTSPTSSATDCSIWTTAGGCGSAKCAVRHGGPSLPGCI